MGGREFSPEEGTMEGLEGRVAIVTGAAEGIGPTYARAMAAAGMHVCLADRLPAEAVVDEIVSAGGSAIGMVCDVTDPVQVANMVAATEAVFGTVHVLVNNAAVFARLFQAPMEEISSADFDRAMAVNVRGPFECTRAVLPAMRRQGYGKIINVASGTAFKGTPRMLHYVASKGAVVSMTRAMAAELGPDGIRVNAIAPGLVMTDAIVAREGEGADFVKQRSVSGRFLGAEQMPDDLVGTLLFLAGPQSDFMTGQILVVDGGSAMH
jgi:NAD(P)-dependent dehydrogenase (short-subunit alcohol dehydrogenase family)